MKKLRWNAFVLLGLLVAPLALAQQPANPQASERVARFQEMLAERFAQADSNGDGLLQAAEAQTSMPRVYQSFAAIDTAGKGAVSLDQIKAYMARRMAQRQAQQGVP